MKISAVAIIVITLFSSSPAYPHGDETHGDSPHLMGTVSAIDAEHLVLKDREGKSVSIKLSKETKYLVGDVAAPASDVKVGDRIVVDVAGKEGSFSATQIRMGSQKPPARGEEGGRDHGDKH